MARLSGLQTFEQFPKLGLNEPTRRNGDAAKNESRKQSAKYARLRGSSRLSAPHGWVIDRTEEPLRCADPDWRTARSEEGISCGDNSPSIPARHEHPVKKKLIVVHSCLISRVWDKAQPATRAAYLACSRNARELYVIKNSSTDRE